MCKYMVLLSYFEKATTVIIEKKERIIEINFFIQSVYFLLAKTYSFHLILDLVLEASSESYY